jgi:hypothetical protein
LPNYTDELDLEPATHHLSFALGVALGRFGPKGEGALDTLNQEPANALPAGILFLDASLPTHDLRDSLGHPTAARLLAAWERYGVSKRSLREMACARLF